MVTTAMEDRVLRREAEQLGATLIVLPTTHRAVRGAVCRTVIRTSMTPVHSPFERRRAERRHLSTGVLATELRHRIRRRDCGTALKDPGC